MIMRDREELFEALAKSNFRRRFALGEKDLRYIESKGAEVVKAHAYEFVRSRLAPAEPKNDGRQTPMKGHPVFVAQHAVGACCRGCLSKWHGIERQVELSEEQVEYVVSLIAEWINRQIASNAKKGERADSAGGMLF